VITNPVKARLRAGEPVIGHWVSLPSPSLVELLASFGMDWLVFDTEHSPIAGERLEDMLRAIKGTPVVPIVRVAGNEVPLIKQALDRGGLGVVVPLVHSARDAQAAVAAAKFPPEGIRGVAGARLTHYGLDLPEYYRTFNQEVLVVIQIETPGALEAVEEIAATPGVDVLFIGPNDLSTSLGIFRQFDHPAFRAACERVLGAARRHGKAAGYLCGGAEEVLERVDQGFTFVGATSDARLFAAAAQALYSRIREGLAARTRARA